MFEKKLRCFPPLIMAFLKGVIMVKEKVFPNQKEH